MLKTIFILALMIGVLSARSQQYTDVLRLQKIEPIQHIEFAQTNQNQYLSFSPSTPQLLVFSQSKIKETEVKVSNRVFQSPPDNMPILGFGASTPKWNMPIAVPDSTVEYYIKNPLLSGTSNLVFRK